MAFDDLTPENVFMYAAKAYERPNCLWSEFEEDLKHFNYVKRLFRRFQRDGELKERLILNHLTIIYNVFGVVPATRLLFYYLRPVDHSLLKTFLLFLNYMPERIPGVRGRTILSSEIPPHPVAVTILRDVRSCLSKLD